MVGKVKKPIKKPSTKQRYPIHLKKINVEVTKIQKANSSIPKIVAQSKASAKYRAGKL